MCIAYRILTQTRIDKHVYLLEQFEVTVVDCMVFCELCYLIFLMTLSYLSHPKIRYLCFCPFFIFLFLNYALPLDQIYSIILYYTHIHLTDILSGSTKEIPSDHR